MRTAPMFTIYSTLDTVMEEMNRRFSELVIICNFDVLHENSLNLITILFTGLSSLKLGVSLTLC